MLGKVVPYVGTSGLLYEELTPERVVVSIRNRKPHIIAVQQQGRQPPATQAIHHPSSNRAFARSAEPRNPDHLGLMSQCYH